MIYKFHYGLWYGGLVGIIPFMFNYAAYYSDATATQHGILYTILPFFALLAKPIVCSFADRNAAHFSCLLFFIFMTVLGFGSLAIYPFIPEFTENHKNVVWILYCVAAFIGNTSMCVVNSIGDSLAINSCHRKDASYGHYRLWGPIGFGIFGAIWGAANEIPSMPKYTPGILTMIAILVLNSLLLLFWPDREEFKVLSLDAQPVAQASDINSINSNPNYGSTIHNQQIAAPEGEIQDQVARDETTQVTMEAKKIKRLKLLWQLSQRDMSIFLFIFMFTFCGTLTGIHWQFFFKYLQQIAENSGASFSTVATFALPFQALGGELVFFMLSGAILNKLGSSITLMVCLLSFALRYLLYAYLIPHVNVYWILLVELLQGPAFGLMYCVLTHQANLYSEKIDKMLAGSSTSNDITLKNSLHATLQGVLGASFEVSIASSS